MITNIEVDGEVLTIDLHNGWAIIYSNLTVDFNSVTYNIKDIIEICEAAKKWKADKLYWGGYKIPFPK